MEMKKTKKARRKPFKSCHFKDYHSCKGSTGSPVLSYIMMGNQRWGKLPEDHILAKVSGKNERNKYLLLESILQEDVGGDDGILEVFNQSAAYNEILEMCDEIVAMHKKVMARRAYAGKKLIELTSDKKIRRLEDVYPLVKEDLLSVFPSKLLGSARNWQTFLPKLECLMHQGYSGVLPMHTMMRGLKQTDIPWLHSLRYNGLRQRIIAKILRFIANWFLTVISSFYHVAYSSDGLKFYDRRYWQQLVDQTYNNMIKGAKLTISTETAECTINTILRLISKGETCRPLLVLQREIDCLKQWNERALRAFLNGIVRKYPWRLNHRGNLQDVITVLQKLSTLRKLGKISSLYFVKVDIDDAFGSIKGSLLQLILKRIFESLIPKGGRIQEHKFGRTKRSGHFEEFLDYQFGQGRRGVPPRGFTFISTRERDVTELIAFLMKGTHVAVRSHGKDHIMTQGVGQGVKISSFLSEVYYRDMVETHFSSFLAHPQDHLLRYADDILLITPDQDRARVFLKKTKAGFPDYSCRMNPAKTLTNVDAPELSVVSYIGGNINFKDLTLTPVFRNHIKGSVKSVRLDRKTCSFKVLKPKDVLSACGNISGGNNHPCFLDLRVNKKEVVLKSIEEGACYLAQRVVNTEALIGGVPSIKFILAQIYGFSKKLVRACRRMFNTRFPTHGKSVSNEELEVATLRGVSRALDVCVGKRKWVRRSVLRKLSKLQAIVDGQMKA